MIPTFLITQCFLRLSLEINFKIHVLVSNMQTLISINNCTIILELIESYLSLYWIEFLFSLDNEVPGTQLSTRYQLKQDGKLFIPNVQSEDAGVFECIVKNGVGNELQKKVTLTVIGEISVKYEFNLYYSGILRT